MCIVSEKWHHKPSGVVANLELWERSEVLLPHFPLNSFPLPPFLSPSFPSLIWRQQFQWFSWESTYHRLCISLQTCLGNASVSLFPLVLIGGTAFPHNIFGGTAFPLDYSTAQTMLQTTVITVTEYYFLMTLVETTEVCSKITTYRAACGAVRVSVARWWGG